MKSAAVMVAARVAELCDAAADEIEARGHTRGVQEDGQGRVCATGAVFYACEQEPRRDWVEVCGVSADGMVLSAVAAHLNVEAEPALSWWFTPMLKVQFFNDHLARSSGEVVAVFRETAESLRPDQQIVVDVERRVQAVPSSPLHTDPRVVIPAPVRDRVEVVL